MLPDVCQHTIFVHVLKCTYLAFVIFAAPRAVDPLRKSNARTASSGTTMDGKFGTELLVVGIGVGMILWHLKGMTLGSDEVEGNGMILLVAISVGGEPSTWVIPTMGTWGGATIIDDVVANSVVTE